jgi:hypothetical protein
MSADLWCAGFRRNPHVPADRALIDVRQPASFRLCRTCWLAWTSHADDQEGPDRE